MGGGRGVSGRRRTCDRDKKYTQIPVQKRERKSTRGRLRCKWEGTIKMYLYVTDWIHLA
jgi:hypothetical protein